MSDEWSVERVERLTAALRGAVRTSSVPRRQGDVYREIEKAAMDLEKADPSLTRAEAITKAIDLNPSLYEAHEAALPDEPSPVPVAKRSPAEVGIEVAANQLQANDPSLDRATALLRACDAYPNMAAAWDSSPIGG